MSNKRHNQKEETNNQSSKSDPYAILNLSPNASHDQIQRSYKELSRSFHPDKQPPNSPQHDAAKSVFLTFKNAHDILSDPVLRSAYDAHGSYGVLFVRRGMNAAVSSDANHQSLYQKLHDLHTVGNAEGARMLLSEAIQYQEYQNWTRNKVGVSGNIKCQCTTTQSRFLGEGVEDFHLDVEKTSIGFSVSAMGAPEQKDAVKGASKKWSMTFGGNSTVQNGETRAVGQVSVGCEPVQGTNINMDLEMGEHHKLTLGSSRVMSNRTFVTTSLSTIPQTSELALSISSHRALFQNTIRASWAMGIAASDLALHYGLLSFTTLYDHLPKCTLKLNLGLDRYPFRITVSDALSPHHNGELSYGWGSFGIDLKGLLTRSLSKYSTFSMGLHHVSDRGLTWLFRLTRGDLSFSVPIMVSTVMNPGYVARGMYMTFLTGLMDEALGDWLKDAKPKWTAEDATEKRKKALRNEERMLARKKMRRDAEQQRVLMREPSEQKRRLEERLVRDGTGGLVILHAVYAVEGGDAMDVTTALQFWVMNSVLHLPSTTKCCMLGFYDVRKEIPVEVESSYMEACRRVWRRLCWFGDEIGSGNQLPVESPVPTLTVRYMTSDGTFEITIDDLEELSLPCSRALRLGGINVQ